MSYKKLEIWQLAQDLTVGVHRMTIEKLPKSEQVYTERGGHPSQRE